MKSKTTAGLLALFLGGIGIHKFYLEENKQGVLYLIFIWTGIPSILAFFNAVYYFTMSNQDFDKLYNRNQNINRSNLNDLKKLANLKDKGVITEKEFSLKKKSTLGL